MNTVTVPSSHLDMSRSDKAAEPMKTAVPHLDGHLMSADDPDNPQRWPWMKKLYASAVSTAFGFVVAFGASSYTVGIPAIMERFGISMTVSILPFSLFIWGIAIAPIWIVHVSEKVGRRPGYLTIVPLFALFTLGACLSNSFASLAVCRFFAGFFGGPVLVLIEGTYADVWSVNATVTYYATLTLASFIGAAAGPLIAGYTFAYGGWRWTQWIVLILAVGAYLFGVAMPETYPRQIIRQRAKRTGTPSNLAPAESGSTLKDMATITFVTPFKMLVTEPIVIVLALYVGFIFAVTFQFFLSIPVALSMTYMFTVQRVGLAFISAIGGSLLGAGTAAVIDKLSSLRPSMDRHPGKFAEEHRMLPGMFGGFLITGSLFWIAWTANPQTHYLVPIFGTLVFIWGAHLVLTSAISYLFDAYPPKHTLSALTAAACFRLSLAGLIPMVIIQMINGLIGAWAFSTFGFISAALLPIPWVIFFFGGRLRAASPYTPAEVSAKLKHANREDEEMQTQTPKI